MHTFLLYILASYTIHTPPSSSFLSTTKGEQRERGERGERKGVTYSVCYRYKSGARYRCSPQAGVQVFNSLAATVGKVTNINSSEFLGRFVPDLSNISLLCVLICVKMLSLCGYSLLNSLLFISIPMKDLFE